MISMLVKASHNARKYINKSVYSLFQVILVSLLLEHMNRYPIIYIEQMYIIGYKLIYL